MTDDEKRNKLIQDLWELVEKSPADDIQATCALGAVIVTIAARQPDRETAFQSLNAMLVDIWEQAKKVTPNGPTEPAPPTDPIPPL